MKKIILIAGLMGLSCSVIAALNSSEQESDSCLIRVAPHYPTKARIQGVEGWVLLQYDVSATGFIENVKILDSQPLGVFDQEAVRALQKWKECPTNKNTAEKAGNKVHIAFNLE